MLLSSRLGDLSTISNISLNLEPQLQPLIDHLYSQMMNLYSVYGNQINDSVLVPVIRQSVQQALPTIPPALLLKYTLAFQMFR